MSEIEEAWWRWRTQLARAEGLDGVRRRLVLIADEMRGRAAGRRGLMGEWRALGVQVERARLAASGACSERGGRRLVLVAAGESPARQRFTAAHEVAHLLLGLRTASSTGDGGGLGGRREERLCDEFASAYLIDRRALARHVRQEGPPCAPGAVLSLCSRFGVNVQPMLIALAEHLAQEPVLLLASRYRAHPDRPQELDMRVDGAAGHRRLFVPRDKRLRTLGLRGLADWALTAPPLEERHGQDRVTPRPRLAAAPVFAGPVRWHARVQGRRPCFLLAVIAVEGLLSAPRELARAA